MRDALCGNLMSAELMRQVMAYPSLPIAGLVITPRLDANVLEKRGVCGDYTSTVDGIRWSDLQSRLNRQVLIGPGGQANLIPYGSFEWSRILAGERSIPTGFSPLYTHVPQVYAVVLANRENVSSEVAILRNDAQHRETGLISEMVTEIQPGKCYEFGAQVKGNGNVFLSWYQELGHTVRIDQYIGPPTSAPVPPISDNKWHQVTLEVNAPDQAKGARLWLVNRSDEAVYFDDAFLWRCTQ
jgi:hypothetical protein